MVPTISPICWARALVSWIVAAEESTALSIDFICARVWRMASDPRSAVVTASTVAATTVSELDPATSTASAMWAAASDRLSAALAWSRAPTAMTSTESAMRAMLALALVMAAASLVAASAICEMFSAIWLVARPEDWAEPAMASLTSMSFWARCESWSIRPRKLDDSELNVATGTPEATTRLMLATRPVSMIIVAMAS